MNKCPVGICQGELYLCGADHGDGWISESSDRWHCHNNSSHNFTIESLAYWEDQMSQVASCFNLVIYYRDTGIVECRSLTLEQIYTNLVTVGLNLASATIEVKHETT